MCPDSSKPTAIDHERCSELLPWLVNSTLEPGERGAVETHLEWCADCRAEVAFLGELAGAVREEAGPQPAAAPLHGQLEEINRRIDRRGLLDFRASRPVRWILAAQAAAILALAAAVSWPPSSAEREYRTLAETPVARPADGKLIRVAFDPEAREVDVRRSLRAVGGEIVAGPNRAGAYVLRVAAGTTGAGDLDPLTRLRRDPLVRLAEPVVDAAPPR